METRLNNRQHSIIKVIPVYKLAYKATDTNILLKKKVNKGNDSEMHEIIPLHRSNMVGINASSGH